MKNKRTAIIAAVLVAALACGGGYIYVQAENAKAAEAAALVLQQEQEAAAQAEAERIAEAEKLAAEEKAAAEKLATAQAEADRLAAEAKAAEESAQAEAERLAAEQAAAQAEANKVIADNPKTTTAEAPKQNNNTGNNAGAADVDNGPEGNKPGYVYIPGIGYIEGEWGDNSGQENKMVDDPTYWEVQDEPKTGW